MHRVLTRLAAHGTSVVLSSHRMDDLAALCSEVTILATGRVVFSGPLGELVTDSDEVDYRLRTSDAAAARRVEAPTSLGCTCSGMMTCFSVMTPRRCWCARRCRPWMTWSRAWSAPV